MDYDYYNDLENWNGGFYELSIEYHPFGDNQRINEALSALCKSNFFNGIWEDKKDYQRNFISLPINIEEDSCHSFYGTLSLSNESRLPCMINVNRVKNESDWIDILIPQSAFQKIYPYIYPITIELNPWLKEINEIYVQLAENIYNKSPFDLAMIGEEVSGHTNQEDITLEFMKNIICILPSQLQVRLGLQEKGKELSNQLRVFD